MFFSEIQILKDVSLQPQNSSNFKYKVASFKIWNPDSLRVKKGVKILWYVKYLAWRLKRKEAAIRVVTKIRLP